MQNNITLMPVQPFLKQLADLPVKMTAAVILKIHLHLRMKMKVNEIVLAPGKISSPGGSGLRYPPPGSFYPFMKLGKGSAPRKFSPGCRCKVAIAVTRFYV